MARDGQLTNNGGRYTPDTRNPSNPVTEDDQQGYTVTPVTGSTEATSGGEGR
jgi:hypothetical protein